jgi:predicted GNAT family N-acyltransferase
MTVPLEASHDRKAFSCGNPELDRYLREQFGQDARRNAARTYVWSEDGTDILGYYTLSACAVQYSSIDDAQIQKLARYNEVPAILIGRLAVSSTEQGKGSGGALLIDALKRCRQMSETLGASLVVVDAKDENAASFYQRYGFIRLKERADRLVTRMVDVDVMLRQ